MNKKDTSLIPRGMYCYTPNGGCDPATGALHYAPCPYWSSNSDESAQTSGYCSFLEIGDWMDGGTFLLWDQVKECGINEYGPEDLGIEV